MLSVGSCHANFSNRLYTQSVPLFLPQDVHEHILRKHLEKFGCFVELKTELRSLEQQPEGVTVTLAHYENSEEEIETTQFDYVVGADGGHSIVRKQLNLDFPGETCEEDQMVIGDIRIKSGVDEEVSPMNLGRTRG